MPKTFQVVGEEQIAPQPQQPTPPVQPSADTQRAIQILAMSLRVVGQRFITGLSNLFTAGALLSAWLLWKSVLPNPSVNQLVGVSLFCGFVLAVEWVRRK